VRQGSKLKGTNWPSGHGSHWRGNEAAAKALNTTDDGGLQLPKPATKDSQGEGQLWVHGLTQGHNDGCDYLRDAAMAERARSVDGDGKSGKGREVVVKVPFYSRGGRRGSRGLNTVSSARSDNEQ
jgi:hypothetical protein